MSNDASDPTEMMGTEMMESMFEQFSQTYTDALKRNMDAQSEFADMWMDSVDEMVSEEQFDDASEGAAQAYESWMQAAESSYERMGDMIQGEDVDPTEFRDIWLNAANEAFKESMSTTAFAAMTGQNLESVLDFQQQMNDTAEETLHGMGFATTGDIREIGERLVEVERRQQAIESKLDQLIDQA
jgi:predicted phage tail protein